MADALSLPPWPPSPPMTPPGYDAYGPVWIGQLVRGFAVVAYVSLGACMLYVCVYRAAEHVSEQARMRAARAEVAEAFSPAVPLAAAVSGGEEEDEPESDRVAV